MSCARRVLLAVVLLLAAPAWADWAQVAAQSVVDGAVVTTYRHEWTGAAVDSTNLNMAACLHQKGLFEAQFDPSIGDASTDARMTLRECDGPSTPTIECPKLLFPPDAISSGWATLPLHKPYVMANATAATTGGDTARVEIRCSVPTELALNPVVNVRDFGAVGNGVADDTAEITAAIASVWGGAGAACNDGASGVVFMPKGDYIVSSTINVPRCVLLKGEHRTATTITAAAGFADSTAVVTLCQEDPALDGIGCAMESISVDQNSVADWGVMTTNGAEGSYIKDFLIRRGDIYGIHLKARAGADPGVHKLVIENGEIYLGPSSSGDRGINFESNTFGPMQSSVKNVTITADSAVAGVIGIHIQQSEIELSQIHFERVETGVNVNAGQVFLHEIHCTNSITTCIWLRSGSGSNATVIAARADSGGSATVLVDDVNSVTVTDVILPSYFQTLRAGIELLPPRGATTTIVCAVAHEGAEFFDTNAGAAGTADDGLLCSCGDDAAQGYLWRAVATPTTELAGASTTDCGT